ncbi:hypothetical protein BSKO_11213 [Bryopsis sp. KO-2023]|nr:hypothetical protein BSKO_11213 [Bryopsis sp. KO-2023]
MPRLFHTSSRRCWSSTRSIHPTRSSLHRCGPIYRGVPRGLRLWRRKLCVCRWNDEGPDEKKRADTGWVKTVASVTLGAFLVWGGVSSAAFSLTTEGRVALERQRLENIIVDEISSRVQQMPDDELLKVLEDLVRSPTQAERSPNKQSVNKSPPRSKTPSEEKPAPISLSEESIVDSTPTPEITPQNETPTPSRKDEREKLVGAFVEPLPKFEIEQANDEAPPPTVVPPDEIPMLDDIDELGLKPGLTVGEIMEQMRDSSLVVPVKVVYSPQEQFLVDALERFGLEPTRMLRVVKAAGAGGVFMVAVLWGPQFVKGLFAWTAVPSDIVEETRASTSPPEPPESTLASGEPRQTTPISPDPPSTPRSREEYEEEPGESESKGSWLSFLPWKWGSNAEASKEISKEGVPDKATLPSQSAKSFEEVEGLESSSRQPEMDVDGPMEGGVLWRKDDDEPMDVLDGAPEGGGVLWRREEAGNGTSIDGDIEEERFFVVEGAMDQTDQVETDEQVPNSAKEEWKPAVWGDPWLEGDSAVDKPSSIVGERRSESAPRVTEASKQGESTTTTGPRGGDGGSFNAGSTNNGEDESEEAPREPAIDEKDLLSNVDDSQTTLAARIALSKRRPWQS